MASTRDDALALLLRSMFDARAAEPVPEHLLVLVQALDDAGAFPSLLATEDRRPLA